MGQLASKVRGHFITRPSQRFNIESRTEKLLENPSKIRPNPKFKIDQETLEQFKRENPEYEKGIHSFDPKLYDRLKKVYVESRDPVSYNLDAHIKKLDPEKPMPLQRLQILERPTIIIKNKDIALKGRLSWETAEELLKDSKEYNDLSGLTTKYKLNSEDDAYNLTKHYQVFNYYDGSEENKTKVEITDPLLPQPDWVDPKQQEKDKKLLQ